MNNEPQSLIDEAYENYKSAILEKEIKKSAFELTDKVSISLHK